jgi:hypothetical protein
VLYHVSNSSLEGCTCPLAAFGYSRDSKRGKPLSGDTGDPTALAATVKTATTHLGLTK